MIFVETKLKGAFILDLDLREDNRGFFARVFCQREFAEHGLNPLIAQANIAFNKKKGTLRGMHFQFPPAAETKLVRCTRGAILDIIVDLRPESPTYLHHIAVELTADNHRGLYVREPLGHIQTTVVVGRELNGDVVEVGWALRPQVHDDVEDGSPGAPHEISLGRCRSLEVHPAQCALLLIESDVGLGDERIEPVLSKLPLAEHAREEASIVLAEIQVEDERTLELCLDEDHDLILPLVGNL